MLERGLSSEEDSLSRLVKKALSLFLNEYQDPSWAEVHKEELLSDRLSSPGDIRGQVAQFASQYDWPSKGDKPLNEKLKKLLEESQKEANASLLYNPSKVEILPEQEDSSGGACSFEIPPWQGLKRLPLDEIRLRYPRHILVRYAVESELHLLAVECTFGSLPSEMHREPKAGSLFKELLERFQSFVERTGKEPEL